MGRCQNDAELQTALASRVDWNRKEGKGMNKAQTKLFIERLCREYDLEETDFVVIDWQIFISWKAAEKMFEKMCGIKKEG